jgi:uncharacterized C2H2 Zn-finger protein
MANSRMIKCPNCGVFNTDRDYCKNCNKLLSQEIIRQQRLEKVQQEEIDKVIYERENPNFIERMKKHPNFLYRFFGWILYSGYVTVTTIGTAIAWFIASIATG